ncbi:class II fructose-bisphosphatase [Glaciibacter psychrotolerans]|uniref:Fructose-1,6-bisphosphatase n=1 Tax=Glaciibacter psychrotolerans TaxID=670054 RepID=A0A7Z0EDT8_9MICO|nr:class II fructose-bisphosphatase [Leifsonia psychrotolerans]NYJ19824.1 fructose-1,6-bisphosphatase II [Leifsonia psychrotolerans]
MQRLFLDNAAVHSLLAVTTDAALAAHGHVGRGDKIAVDGAAVQAMRTAFDRVDVAAVVVIGEGEKDEAPLLFAGERLGTGRGPALDVAVDPVDGTRLAAQNLPDAVAVLAVAPAGAFFDPGPVFYLEKLVTSGNAGRLSLSRPLTENLHELARALDKPLAEVRVAVQSRPRNQRYIDEATAVGARVLQFADGDVAVALRAARVDGDIDLLIGIGGSPEGVLTSAAVRAVNGHMEARLAPQHPAEIARARSAGLSTERILDLDDLIDGDGYFFLTAITDGDVLAGVSVVDSAGRGTTATTDSWVIDPHRGIRRFTLTRQRG